MPRAKPKYAASQTGICSVAATCLLLFRAYKEFTNSITSSDFIITLTTLLQHYVAA
jgi:hypothetical protein